MNLSSSLLRIILLLASLQVYITISSLIFQKLEKPNKNKEVHQKLINVIKQIQAKSRIQNNDKLTEDLRKALNEDDKNKMQKSFQGIDQAYLFTLMSFTTLGNSGFRLTTWQARLFYIFSIPVGFALYVVIIISLAYHIRDAMQAYVTALENKSQSDVRYLNLKILLISFMVCVCALQIGAVAAIIRKHGYLYGLYLSIDLMAFVGNEDILERGQSIKLYFSFLLSFYLILLHSFLLVFISSCCHAWKEISDVASSQNKALDCFNPQIQPLSSDYKEKLLASFDSSSSGTPPNETASGDDPYFSRFKEDNTVYNLDIVDSDIVASATPERKDSRFSEIFNAQKNNFDPIHESNEPFDAEVVDASSVKSTEEDIAAAESKDETLNFFDNVASDANPEIEIEGPSERADDFLFHSGASSPQGSSPSLPSSYSNISLDGWEDEGEDETLSASRLSRDLEASLLGDSDNTITQK